MSTLQAHARRTDPETSHAAAASVLGLRQSQYDVLGIIADWGPLCDDALISKYQEYSDAGLRPQQRVRRTAGTCP